MWLNYLGSVTLISLKPALVNRSLTHLTAWKGDGDALTKERKSLAAVTLFKGIVRFLCLGWMCLYLVPRKSSALLPSLLNDGMGKGGMPRYAKI